MSIAPASTGQRPTVAAPDAVRVPARRWRDVRLLLGVVLLLGSAVAGARLLAAADDSVPTWVAARDLPAGAALDPADLQQVPARLGSGHPYVTGEIPDGFVLVRPVGEGELVPLSAVAPAVEVASPRRLVAVAVSAATTPAVQMGDRVDVWDVPDGFTDGIAGGAGPAGEAAVLVVEDVPVAAVGGDDSAFAASSADRSVVLSLDAANRSRSEFEAIVARLVSSSAAGRTVLTVDPGPR